MRRYCGMVLVILGMFWYLGCGFWENGQQEALAPKAAAGDAGADTKSMETAGEGKNGAASGNVLETDPQEETGNEETKKDGPEAGQEGQPLPLLVMVNSELYRYAGEFADEDLRCGMMDGEITLAVSQNEVPAQDNQSNFGVGYGYQYGAENEIQVYMPYGETKELHWLRFGKCNPTGEDREDTLLTEAPQLSLKDALSSSFACFTISPIGYTWNYGENGEMTGIAACGAHPLDDEKLARTPVLQLPRYNGLDFIPFCCSCVVEPDVLTIRKWEMSALGQSDAEPVSVLSYKGEMPLLELESGFVYGLIAEWEKESFDKNGYYGVAEYAFVTQ